MNTLIQAIKSFDITQSFYNDTKYDVSFLTPHETDTNDIKFMKNKLLEIWNGDDKLCYIDKRGKHDDFSDEAIIEWNIISEILLFRLEELSNMDENTLEMLHFCNNVFNSQQKIIDEFKDNTTTLFQSMDNLKELCDD